MQTQWFTILDTETGEKHNALSSDADAAKQSVAVKLGGIRNGGDKHVVPGDRYLIQQTGERFGLSTVAPVADASTAPVAVDSDDQPATARQMAYLDVLINRHGYTGRMPPRGALTRRQASAAIAEYDNPINY